MVVWWLKFVSVKWYEDSSLGVSRDGDICRRWERRLIRQLTVLSCPLQKCLQLILGRPFTTTLDVVASLIHIKLKFHSLYNELAIVNTDLKGGKKIYQALQQDQIDNKAMEINVAYLTGQLGSMNIRPLKSGWSIKMEDNKINGAN